MSSVNTKALKSANMSATCAPALSAKTLNNQHADNHAHYGAHPPKFRTDLITAVGIFSFCTALLPCCWLPGDGLIYVRNYVNPLQLYSFKAASRKINMKCI